MRTFADAARLHVSFTTPRRVRINAYTLGYIYNLCVLSMITVLRKSECNRYDSKDAPDGIKQRTTTAASTSHHYSWAQHKAVQSGD